MSVNGNNDMSPNYQTRHFNSLDRLKPDIHLMCLRKSFSGGLKQSCLHCKPGIFCELKFWHDDDFQLTFEAWKVCCIFSRTLSFHAWKLRRLCHKRPNEKDDLIMFAYHVFIAMLWKSITDNLDTRLRSLRWRLNSLVPNGFARLMNLWNDVINFRHSHFPWTSS